MHAARTCRRGSQRQQAEFETVEQGLGLEPGRSGWGLLTPVNGKAQQRTTAAPCCPGQTTQGHSCALTDQALRFCTLLKYFLQFYDF